MSIRHLGLVPRAFRQVSHVPKGHPRQSRGRESWRNVFHRWWVDFQKLPEGSQRDGFLADFRVFLCCFLEDSYDKLINFVFSTFLPLIFRSSPFKWIGFFCSRFGARKDICLLNGELKSRRIWTVHGPRANLWNHLPSLKPTFSDLKMDGWKTIVSSWEGLFSGAMLVLGRVHDPKKSQNMMDSLALAFLDLRYLVRGFGTLQRGVTPRNLQQDPLNEPLNLSILEL